LRGHLRKRSPGSWQITVDRGRDPASGKRRQHMETVRGSKRDAEARLAELVTEIEGGRYRSCDRKLTVAKYLTDWIRECEAMHLRPRTSEGYKSIVNHSLVPALGQLPLCKLEARHISTYCAGKLEAGLCKRTVRNHFMVLHKSMADAVRQGLLGANPCDGVSAPRPLPQEINILDLDDLPRFLSAIEKAAWPYAYLFYTMVCTGIRRAEAVALRWSAIDLDGGTLVVRETLHRVRGKTILSPPKTKKGRRRIDLLPSLVTVLRRYREQVNGLALLLEKPVSRDDFVFCRVDGSPLEPNTVSHVFRRLMRAAELHVHLHSLRHTFASLMIAANVNIKVISEWLGHSSISVTMDIYGHLMSGVGRSAAEQADRFLGEILGGENDNQKPRAKNVVKMLSNGVELGARLEGFEPTTLGSEDRCSVR
jgi:integrase